jgi:TatD DNase family protein
MKLFDSHCHLDDRSYEKEIDAVIHRAQTAGVEAVMTVGTGLKSSAKAISLAETNPNVYASVGMHPHDAKGCDLAILESLRSLARNRKVRAWGETGLDFNRMYSSQKDQESCFERQLEIALELNLPVIFHERDSRGRLLDILKAHQEKEKKGVVHCFSGSPAELKAYLNLGLFIGVTGILTLKDRGVELRRMVRGIPEKRLVIETDAPYLTPAPEKNRVRRNEPAFVRSVLFKLAAVRQETPEHLSTVIWENTCRLYNIDTESEEE